MPDREEYLIFIRELGRLLEEYYQSPESIKPFILNDIKLLGEVLSLH
ncbi:hypothetical protein J14TS2_22620 [Bacillus sp. J14TS2]|nr:hypothetical protein [Bacillus sp. J14TS2]GIN71787.1 hypothetical protein J14TS2_22620 [Bacillus sp. J14TS2]